MHGTRICVPLCSCASRHRRRVVIRYPRHPRSLHSGADRGFLNLTTETRPVIPTPHPHRTVGIMSDSNDTADVDLPPSPVSSGRRATTPSRPSGVPRISSRAVEGGTLACRRCHHRKKKVSESGGPLRTIPAYPPCLVESSVTEHHISVIARNRIVVVASRAGWNACTTSSSRTSRIPSEWGRAPGGPPTPPRRRDKDTELIPNFRLV
jgi:hypothetical protein